MTSHYCTSETQTAELSGTTSTPLQLDEMVRRVQRNDASGMLDLYEYILLGLRPYLARQLRPQDYRDNIHNIFLDVVVAIQRGQLREPERLMGFARTIARRKVSLYIDSATWDRRNQVEVGSLFGLASPGATPEMEMLSQEQREVVRLTLAGLSGREAEILSRFYLQEQTETQIRSKMNLTHTQYRLLKWRSKARFEELSRRQMASRHLKSLCTSSGPHQAPVPR